MCKGDCIPFFNFIISYEQTQLHIVCYFLSFSLFCISKTFCFQIAMQETRKSQKDVALISFVLRYLTLQVSLCTWLEA